MHELCKYKTHHQTCAQDTIIQTLKHTHNYTQIHHHMCILYVYNGKFCEVQIFTILAIKIQHTKI